MHYKWPKPLWPYQLFKWRCSLFRNNLQLPFCIVWPTRQCARAVSWVLPQGKVKVRCFLKQLLILCNLCTVTIIESTQGHSIGSSAGIKVELSADLVCVALPVFLCALFLAHRFEVLFGEVPWCAACCQTSMCSIFQSGVLWCSPWCKMVFPFEKKNHSV